MMTSKARTKQSVESLICGTLEGPAQQLAASLFGEKPLLDHSSLAGRADAKLIATEMASRCVSMNQRGEINSIELSVDFLPSLASPSDQGRLDRPKVIKAVKRQDGFAPHSVAKICVIPVPLPNGDGEFFYLPAMANFTMGLTECLEPISKRSKRSRTAATAELALGLTFDRVRYNSPSDEEVRDAACAFNKINRTLCNTANKLLNSATGKNSSKKSRFLRELGMLQILSQIPVNKGYIGHGVGIDLLEHALVEPMSRAKHLKKSKQAWSRAQALNVWWCDTVENLGKRNKPPFVIL